MKYDVLYNFISPITGRLPLINDYILVGGNDNFSIPSPKLIDIQLDIIDIRHDYDNLAASNFIIGFPNNNLSKAQVLSDLDNGFMFNTDGVVSTKSVMPLPSLEYKKIWIGDENNTAVETQTINLENLPALGTTIVPNPLSLDFVGQVYEGTSSGVPKASNIVGDMFADIVLINARFATVKFVLNDGNVALQALMPASQFLSNVTSGLPIQISSNPLTPGKIEVAALPYNYLWVGDAQGRVSSQPNIILSNLPNLTEGKIWKGDVTNRPVEVDANYAPNDAKYILKTPNNSLNNAQALSELAGGILKSASLTGTISIASGGSTIGVDDYVTPTALTEAIEGVIAEATEAGSVAGTAAGTAAATVEIAAAMPGILAEAGTAGGTAGGIAGGTAGTAAATLVLLAKESKSDHDSDISAVNTRIDNLHIPPSNAKYILNQQASGLTQAQVLSDLIGGNYPNGGLLKVTSIDGIIKIASPTIDYADPNKENTFLEQIYFQKDVKCLSHGAIKIPVGNSVERPSNAEQGMLRYNTDI